MDDNNFDDLLKGKLKNYEDPIFDPSALDGLHERIRDFQPAPWYASNGLRIAFISSLFLLTTVNTYFFIHNVNPKLQNNNTFPEFKLSYSKTIDSLKAVIHQLQSKVTEQKIVNSFLPTLATPKFKSNLSKEDKSSDFPTQDLTYKVNVGSKENIPPAIYNKLKEEGLLVDKDEEVFLVMPKKTNLATQPAFYSHISDLLMPVHQPETVQLISTNMDRFDKNKSVDHMPMENTSLVAKNALEKHHFNTLKIQLAPHVDLVKAIFAQGAGGITPRVGLTADWLISPRFSIESGVDYTTTQDLLNHNEIPRYSQYNPQLGSCQAATLTNRLVSVPINLKFRNWISNRSQLILKVGYTPYNVLTKQSQYNYVRPNINTTDVDQTTTIYNEHDIKYFGNTISTAAGMAIKREENKGLWEASLYYEHSISRGFDQKSMQLIGLRTAYWFSLK